MGLVAYIARHGNTITINLPIAFSGGDQETYNAMAMAIHSNWTGQSGQYNVTTNVIDGTHLTTWATNTVTVLPGNGIAEFARGAGGLSKTTNSRHGDWYAAPTRGQCLDYAHEAGHLMGLGEWNDIPNLMNQNATTSDVYPAVIEAILASPNNVLLNP